MAKIEFDEYKVKLTDLSPRLEALGESLGLGKAREDLERLHAMAESDGFWNDTEKSQKVTRQIRQLETKIASYEKMCTDREDLLVLCDMAIEEDDNSMLEELVSGYESLEERMEQARLETLLTGEYDGNNVLMSFHAGAGGTEAQDWCQMLYRMYTRWAERHGFTYKIMDYLEGEEAGLKSADILIEGENAYGFLKGENGVHRLDMDRMRERGGDAQDPGPSSGLPAASRGGRAAVEGVERHRREVHGGEGAGHGPLGDTPREGVAEVVPAICAGNRDPVGRPLLPHAAVREREEPAMAARRGGGRAPRRLEEGPGLP